MNKIKPGDTVYVIATCADTLKRGSGTCWFQEFGGCPYQESGALDYCGEREDVPAVFQTVVDSEDESGLWVRGLSFGFAGESAPLHYIGKRIFTDRADAIEALEAMEQERERKRQERRERATIEPCNWDIVKMKERLSHEQADPPQS